MLRCGVCLAALALTTIVTSPVFADTVDDLLKKVDAKRYSPIEHGLMDLKVEVKNPMFAMNPAMANAQIFLYWKSPDKKAARIEGLDPGMAGMMGQMLEGLKGMLATIIPEPYDKQREKFDYTLSTEGDYTVLTGVPKPGTEEAKGIKQVKIWFNADGLPVRQESEGEVSSKMEMTYTEKDGKFLVESAKGEADAGQMGMQQIEMSMSYAQVEGMWFPAKIVQNMGGMSLEFTFEGYEVNKGLDDSLFGSSGTESDPGDGGTDDRGEK